MGSIGLKRDRPDAINHFFNRARTAAERSTCLRRKIGAVIIGSDGVELSSGYVGSPRKTPHCIEVGKCIRIEAGINPGENYELCRSAHAEQNAIINAARVGISIFGGEMYIHSERIKGAYNGKRKRSSRIYGPCTICKKEIINSGLTAVHMREEGIGDETFTIEDLRRMLVEEEEEWHKKRCNQSETTESRTS